MQRALLKLLGPTDGLRNQVAQVILQDQIVPSLGCIFFTSVRWKTQGGFYECLSCTQPQPVIGKQSVFSPAMQRCVVVCNDLIESANSVYSSVSEMHTLKLLEIAWWLEKCLRPIPNVFKPSNHNSDHINQPTNLVINSLLSWYSSAHRI